MEGYSGKLSHSGLSRYFAIPVDALVSHKPKNDSVKNTHEEAVFSEKLPVIWICLLLRFTEEASSVYVAVPALDKASLFIVVKVLVESLEEVHEDLFKWPAV